MSKGYPQLELDRQLCFPLYAAARAVVRAYAPLLDDVGLTYPQYLVMLALWGDVDDPMTVGEVGRRLQLDTGTLTPLLKRLAAAGYVVRRRDPLDERRVLLDVTDRGRELRHLVAHVPAGLARATGISEDDAAALRRLLGGLVARLEAGDAAPAQGTS